MDRGSLTRFSGICGIAGPVAGITLVLAATVVSRSFSWERSALSDLGVAEPEAALLFNTGVIAAGILFLLFIPGLSMHTTGGKRTRVGIATLVIGGASLILVGVFTEAYGALHTAVSAGYFILVPLGILLMGLGSSGWSPRVSRLSIAAGALSLFVILITQSLLTGAGVRVGFAVPEIIEALILASWTVSMAAWLLRR